MVQKILTSHNSVLFLNGHLPDIKDYNNYIDGKVKIASDGAAIKLIHDEIYLDYVIGDLDSLGSINKSFVNQIIKINDQNTTDFEKCLNFIMKNKLSPTLIFGIGGGEIDHAINNIFSMCNHSLSDLSFLDINDRGKKFGKIITNSNLEIYLPMGSKISLIPYPSALVTTDNLKWNIENQLLSNLGFISARNYNISEKININVHQGKLLVIADIKEKS
ncbi:MAG: thiamine pyrophosphokinase [Candidatus Midichloriaceae bacterium]|jgi:thiamine pyrophosphokinase